MNLLIISSSQRLNSQSAKVAAYIEVLAGPFEQVTHIELSQCDLGYWDGESVSKQKINGAWEMINDKLSFADAFVLVTPEWGGMASPLLKNFLLMSESTNCAHKPALLVSVSAGIGGAYPIAELKMNAFKNNKIVPTPDHLIVRNVQDVLNHPLQGSQLTERDLSLRERVDYCLRVLGDYALALRSLRINRNLNPYLNRSKFSYGM